ncbi:MULTISPECIES: PAQR family membrane homeostasis protein TrhA [unclassified Colwellia]|jgi:hemolysin III|uniref:PAQR family membrane homeostasis protein TrhA n=1 Tax=unclassified Colwellia TaxID=196834 RepID=UPI0015F41900|nr:MULTISPECIES: hemolysin III family protein [unclassified Colwellia]MBA6335864.1 hemolysin III family protein [Colwellia sp. BRX8-7]MBA6354378.1 hemolysin III family protein [Colwellia sp. BRX8-3]MBA6358355.1 hemolysin III family protein [Colwellia sp. BRX8-6]MBA6365892.1 hemolysin III family protein [Colwellia sp. BRX8-5]MBA6375592.1 hemolysin III family protein [Colwellia sp. BRX8-2]
MTSQASYSKNEEIANTLTHALGAILSVMACYMLLTAAFTDNSLVKIVSYAVYGASLVLLFTASTFYHAFQDPDKKKLFKLLDHCAIYLLIAGTYTPLMMVALNDQLGTIMLTIIWSMAILGVFFKMKFGHRYKKTSLITYLGMGLISITIIEQLNDKLSNQALTLLALGGIIYCLGVIFYVQKRIHFNHAIWHLFVLGGAACHFFMIYFYL